MMVGKVKRWHCVRYVLLWQLKHGRVVSAAICTMFSRTASLHLFFFFHKAASIVLLMIWSLLRRLRRSGSLLYYLKLMNGCWSRKAAFSTTDFTGLILNTEHTLVLTCVQTLKTKRDGYYHRRLQLLSRSRGWPHVFMHLRVLSPHFEGVYGMARILPHFQVDLGAVCTEFTAPCTGFHHCWSPLTVWKSW